MVDEIGNSRLIITDGTIKINLHDLGFQDWIPQTAPWKEGGVFSDSQFSDKTALIARQFTSTVDTFTLEPNAFEQDTIVKKLLELEALLEKAVAYQVTRWQNEPVWIEACGQQETNKRYALITAYQMPQLDNPFQAPFTVNDGTRIAIEEFTLVINHDIWQGEPPGENHCVLGNSIQTVDYPYSATPEFEEIRTISGYDNISYYKSSDSYIVAPTAIHAIDLGRDNDGVWNTLLVFRDTHLHHFDKIVDARILFISADAAAAGDVKIHVTALNNRGPYKIAPDLLTSEMISELPRTAAYLDVTLSGDLGVAEPYFIMGLDEIIQEVVDDPAFEYGDDICFVIEDNGTDLGDVKNASGMFLGGVFPPSPPAPPYDAPLLYLDTIYSQYYPDGQEDTCEDHVFLANKHNRAQITDVIVHDAIGGVYTHITQDPFGTLPFDLFPFPTIHNMDELYVGIDVNAIQSGPFSNVIFDLSFPHGGGPGIDQMEYYYCNGAGFSAFVPNTYTDETEMFSKPGVHGFFFIQPSDMGHDTIDGTDAYWIKFVVIHVAGTRLPPTQSNRYVYTVNTPFFDIPASSCGGDIPSIAKTKIHVHNLSTLGGIYTSNYLAIRSMIRGIDFTPYLNCSDVLYQVPGLTCVDDVAESSFVNDDPTFVAGSATGKVGQFIPGGYYARKAIFTWEFDDTLASQYIGKYAFYLRKHQDPHAPNGISVGLSFTWGGMVEYETPEVLLLHTAVDIYLGTFDLTMGNVKGERFYKHEISLTASADNGTGTLYIFDLVMVPVDEFAILIIPQSPAYYMPATEPWKNGIVVDSIGYPKDLVRVFFYDATCGDLSNMLEYYLPGQWMQQTGHQRIWYYGLGVGTSLYSLHHSISLQQYATFRYALGMRGAQ